MRSEILLRIRRQDGPNEPGYTQEFRLDYRPNLNVIACLQEIARNPVDAQGKRVAPPVWDCNCLEEVCGACTMLINDVPQQSCSCLIDNLPEGPIELAPLTKYQVVRDLVVDRQPMFDALKRVKAWMPVDGTHPLGPGPKRSPEQQQAHYILSRCMTCGCCMEACPNYDGLHPEQFVGPAPLSQAQLFNNHPTGEMIKNERLDALMDRGGIAACGNAQNCVEVCPKDIPLTEAIAELNKETNKRWLKKLFGGR